MNIGVIGCGGMARELARRSAELGRPFGLALVKGGRSRIGDTLHVPVDGTLVAVEVTGTVLVDPEGARRDG